MNLLYSNLESGQNALIIGDNNKENYLDILQVLKGLMYEKYSIFIGDI